jgi:radical SAM protein with 4Fe4S-binding SPASM domain
LSDSAGLYSKLPDGRKNRLRDMIPLDMPLTFYIDPTNHCNFRCSFCPRSFDDFSKYAGNFQHMDINLFKKIILEIQEWGKLKSLKFYYLGEPFLHPAYMEMLRIVIDNNISERIEITTNGSLLNNEISKELISLSNIYSGDIYIRFSIYSVVQEKHEKITKSPILIQDIWNNVKQLKNMRDSAGSKQPFLYAKMINTFSNENEKFFNMYRELVDEVIIEQPMNWSGYDERKILQKIYNDEQLANFKISNGRKVCAYPFYTLAITPDGDVVCCCVDWSRMTKVGNVRKQGLKEIWAGERLKQLQLCHLQGDRHLNAACKNCDILHGLHEMDNIDDVLPEVLLVQR